MAREVPDNYGKGKEKQVFVSREMFEVALSKAATRHGVEFSSDEQWEMFLNTAFAETQRLATQGLSVRNKEQPGPQRQYLSHRGFAEVEGEKLKGKLKGRAKVRRLKRFKRRTLQGGTVRGDLVKNFSQEDSTDTRTLEEEYWCGGFDEEP